MAGIRFTDIGHSSEAGPVAVWSVGSQGDIHEVARLQDAGGAFEPPTDGVRAFGRVELQREAGSVCLVGGIGGGGGGRRASNNSEEALVNLLDALEEQYPHTRWYVFRTDGDRVVPLAA